MIYRRISMNIDELEQEIQLVRNRIYNSKSIKLKNDLGKYLKRLIKEKKDYYKFINGTVRHI
jgi:hypothetical protein